MTIDELIERLEDYRAELGGDAEVRLMTQENWPFENEIVGVASAEDVYEQAEEENDEEDHDPDSDFEDVLYIVEGRQLGYGSKDAWVVAR